MRLPCAGAPWPSRAARTSCAPLALPEQAAYPLTPRRARRSTPHQHACAFLRPVQNSAHCFWHLTSGCTRTRREYDADSAPRKARTHARTRTRAHPLSLLHSLSACLHTQQTAPSARVLRTAPLPPRACLHCTRRARGTLRARTPARARARAQPLSAAQTASLPAHTAYSTMGTHTPNDAARTPQQ